MKSYVNQTAVPPKDFGMNRENNKMIQKDNLRALSYAAKCDTPMQGLIHQKSVRTGNDPFLAAHSRGDEIESQYFKFD
jgi:hypothetical protein